MRGIRKRVFMWQNMINPYNLSLILFDFLKIIIKLLYDLSLYGIKTVNTEEEKVAKIVADNL